MGPPLPHTAARGLGQAGTGIWSSPSLCQAWDIPGGGGAPPPLLPSSRQALAASATFLHLGGQGWGAWRIPGGDRGPAAQHMHPWGRQITSLWGLISWSWGVGTPGSGICRPAGAAHGAVEEMGAWWPHRLPTCEMGVTAALSQRHRRAHTQHTPAPDPGPHTQRLRAPGLGHRVQSGGRTPPHSEQGPWVTVEPQMPASCPVQHPRRWGGPQADLAPG